MPHQSAYQPAQSGRRRRQRKSSIVDPVNRRSIPSVSADAQTEALNQSSNEDPDQIAPACSRRHPCWPSAIRAAVTAVDLVLHIAVEHGDAPADKSKAGNDLAGLWFRAAACRTVRRPFPARSMRSGRYSTNLLPSPPRIFNIRRREASKFAVINISSR